MTDIQVGDRVVTLRADGTPGGSIGTVEAYRDFERPYAIVAFDSDYIGYSERKAHRRVPAIHLQVVGCDYCNGTGITAEKREGHLYRSACSRCFPEGRSLFWTDAEEYHLLAVV